MLPPAQSEHFLSLVTKFQQVPDDDEYLQLLEAVGFMTLLWKEVPSEITTILEKANPISETCHTVSRHVREAVIEAIPSYEDLRSIVSQLNEHELALKRGIATLQSPNLKQSKGFSILIALLVGSILGVLMQFSFSLLS